MHKHNFGLQVKTLRFILSNMDIFTQPETWVALATLTALEIVLGIDNIIFISILAGKLPKKQQAKARQSGLIAAMLSRILLLFSISLIMKLTAPLFPLLGHEVTGKDLILMIGGLFLIFKSTREIHHKLEGESGDESKHVANSFASVIAQIMLLDLVFSIDSVITAIGMVKHLSVMITAVVISVGIMLVAAGSISDFVNKHPTLKMLALSFLLLIGFTLVIEGMGQHVGKGYIYFAMGFSFLVELLNMRLRAKARPVVLREHVVEE